MAPGTDQDPGLALSRDPTLAVPDTVGRFVFTTGPLITVAVVELAADADEYPVRLTVTRTDTFVPASADRTEYVEPDADGIAEPLRCHWYR